MSLNLRKNIEVVSKYNKAAIDELKQENFDISLSHLRQALGTTQKISDPSTKNKLLAVTFNNLGNFFKKVRKPQEALKYFSKTTELEDHLSEKDSSNIGLAHLSISSILSQQGDHKNALNHSLKSLKILNLLHSTRPKLVTSLIIAYINTGAEYKHISDINNSEKVLKIGLKISSKLLGNNHNLTQTLRQHLNDLFQYSNIEKTKKNFNNTQAQFFPSVNRRSTSDSDKYNRKFSPHESFNRTQDMMFTKKNSRKKIENAFNNEKRFKDLSVRFKNTESEDEENNKSVSSYPFRLFRRIDISRHKATEKIAATILQSWWRGVLARKKFNEIRVMSQLRNAEHRAKKAIEEYEKCKVLAEKLKRKNRK